MDADLALALKLQEEFDRAENVACVESGPLSSTPGAPLSLADESWEVMDPNPDIRALFLQYNDRFFWGRLAGIEVKWSPRMTLCAGLCVYEGRGGLCSVRLSLPLLKLRPRRDLVQTLLKLPGINFKQTFFEDAGLSWSMAMGMLDWSSVSNDDDGSV